jgi:hypothetical protein
MMLTRVTQSADASLLDGANYPVQISLDLIHRPRLRKRAWQPERLISSTSPMD